MRVLVCGGRDFYDKEFVYNWLTTRFITLSPTLLIHGGARGVDRFAEMWALRSSIKIKCFQAEWDIFGRRAGYIRNKQMLEEGKPDLVLAFPGGKGTKMMIELAKIAGVPVEEVHYP